MVAYKRIYAADFDFGRAPLFRKIESYPVENVVIALGGEIVITHHKSRNGEEFIETINTANSGDAIVTRSPGDVYVVSAEKFKSNFEIDPINRGRYHSKNFGKAIQILENFVILAPWGSDQNIEAGGVIFQNRASNEVYGNQQESFEGDFAREARDGTLIRLKTPLAVQIAWALQKREIEHLKDLRSRIEAILDGLMPDNANEAHELRALRQDIDLVS